MDKVYNDKLDTFYYMWDTFYKIKLDTFYKNTWDQFYYIS